MSNDANRPYFLDLIKIRLPLPGIVSILHRISGVLLILVIPVSLYLLELSLSSADNFDQTVAYTDSLIFKFIAALIIWSLCHHLFSGIRFLLLDLDIGIEHLQARFSSAVVLVISIVTTIILIGAIL